jgi:hypothetical protein
VNVAAIDAERLLDYADQWRTLARGWADTAGKDHNPGATKLRHMAQMALYAAYEAEQLLKARCDAPLEVRVPVPRPLLRIMPEPLVSESRLRHGPLGYFAPMGPLVLAGQRPRRGPYSMRRAAQIS